ncbi:MAG: hypothetical protein M1813_002614 [Trichoglossum hirsutum]|nr:MAG: hypothetical protein M1813_002614 [Trichoglossum hirsutum]
MDPFHHRDMTGNGQYEYSLPLPHSETSFWRSSPPTPQPSYSSPSLLRSLPSLNPVRNITPPEDTIPLGEEQHAVVEESKSPYNQVREYVDSFKSWSSGVRNKFGSLEVYESNLSIKMSQKEWNKLSSDLNIFEIDDRFPKYSYNSSTSTLIVQFMATPIHESIISIIADGFAITKSTLPSSVRTRINTVGNQNFKGFGGRYKGSNKIPDLGVEFRSAAGKREIKIVLEVGLSEKYEDLVQDAKLWLEGNHDVCVFILAKFEETPKYRNPARNLSDEDFEQLEFPDASEIDMLNINLEGEHGRAVYKGLVWVNCISAAFIEVWKRDPVNNLATQSGNRIDLHTEQPQLEFKLSNFLDITAENERTISFEWDEYRLLVEDKVKQLAVLRCQEMLEDRAGLTDLRDSDYEPSSD